MNLENKETGVDNRGSLPCLLGGKASARNRNRKEILKDLIPSNPFLLKPSLQNRYPKQKEIISLQMYALPFPTIP